MGVETKAIVKDDIKSVIKTLEHLGKKLGYTVKFDGQRYKEEGFSTISLEGVGRLISVYDFKRLNNGRSISELVKEGVLPKNGRTLKNAKNGVVLSLGSDKHSQQLLYNFLKIFPTHGYLQLNDSSRGGFIYVDETGFVKTKGNRSPQELKLVDYFNKLSNEVNTNIEDLLKEDVEDINKVFYKYAYNNEGSIYTYNVGRKLIEELVVYMDNGEVYLISGIEFRDLKNPKSYYTPVDLRNITKLPVAKDIGKRDFEDIYHY